MPKVTNGQDLWGFQLWVNLAQKDKMVKPRYQDYQADEIPVYESPEVRVRVMAGTAYGHTGPIDMRNPGMLLDVTVKPGGKFVTEVPEDYNVFCYVCDGSGKVGGREASREHAVLFEPGGNAVDATADARLMRFLLVAGRPIGERVVQYGPFVMNTEQEIRQAFLDYRSGKLQDPGDDVWASWEDCHRQGGHGGVPPVGHA